MKGLLFAWGLGAVAGLGLVSSGLARGSSLSVYNVIVFNNMTTHQSDVGGPVLVGGNLTSNNYTVFNGGLTVNGQISGTFTLNAGPIAYGSNTATWNNNPHATPGTPTDDMSAIKTELKGVSSAFEGMPANSTTSFVSGNELDFNASTSLAVFDINGSVLNDSTYGSLKLNMGSATEVVINVSGTDVTFNGGNMIGDWTNERSNLVWNFYQATSVTIDKQFEGTVLAPFATVANNNAAIEGTVVADTYNLNGEVHDYRFRPATPTAVPLPPAVATGALGLFLVVGALGLRRVALK